MNSIQDESKLFDQIMNLLQNHFGNQCEIVLHDLTTDYSKTIADIRNGHITNRQIGGCGSNLGLEVLSGSVIDGDRFNYITHTMDGKTLRSSSIYIKNDNGVPIASICINYDITDTIKLEGILKQFNNYNISSEISSEPQEVFVQDVTALLDFLIEEAQRRIGKDVKAMNKDERIQLLTYLDSKGAFLITRSSEKVCELLSISRFTFYNDLDCIRNKNTPT